MIIKNERTHLHKIEKENQESQQLKMNVTKRKKKSGSENRKIKKQRLQEEAKYKAQMQNYFFKKTSERNEEEIQNPEASLSPQPQCSAEMDSTITQDKEEITQRTINTDENYNIQDPEYNAGFPDNIPNTALNINDISLTEQQLSERPSNDDQIESDIAEGDESKSDVDDDLSSSEDISSLQPDVGDVFVVSSVLGKTLTHEEKLAFLKQKPCQPSKSELSKRKKRVGKIDRHCSENVFCRKDGTNRTWLTYSLEDDALYCIPCLLFSDATLRGENQRKNQGSAFSKDGFSNWKKKSEHEESQIHINSKLAQVMFLQKKVGERYFERSGETTGGIQEMTGRIKQKNIEASYRHYYVPRETRTCFSRTSRVFGI